MHIKERVFPYIITKKEGIKLKIVLATKSRSWDSKVHDEISGVEVVGIADNEEQLLTVLKDAKADALIVSEFIHMDFDKMKKMLEHIRSSYPNLKIIYYAMVVDDNLIVELNELSIYDILDGGKGISIEQTQEALFRE